MTKQLVNGEVPHRRGERLSAGLAHVVKNRREGGLPAVRRTPVSAAVDGRVGDLHRNGRPEASLIRQSNPLSDSLQILPVREVLWGVVVRRTVHPVPDAAVNLGVDENGPGVLATESPEAGV